ncbi:MAG: phosphate acyltransferase PlsX [Firmicutes bacterium]|nr:phosphate acyltransferase PlsX [Bacillota bacterium]
MKIALDAMGGDYGPTACVEGAADFIKTSDAVVQLVGDPQILEPLVSEYGHHQLEVVPAWEVIDMHEHPVQAVRHKSDSSMVVAARQIKQGLADAFVSAGNTGAAMTAAFIHMGRIPGIERPAIVSPLPVIDGETILLDVGANVDCRPRHLLQFAGMGRAYMQKVRDIPEPSVALLNIGAESSKGNELTTKAYQMLSESGLNFVGNIEGRQVFSGQVNVIVSDGFVGNAVLKVSEGLAGLILGVLWNELVSKQTDTGEDSAAKKVFDKLRHILDYTEYGGAPLLGVDGVAIICHGSSNALAVCNALKVAENAVAKGLRNSILDTVNKLGGDKS